MSSTYNRKIAIKTMFSLLIVLGLCGCLEINKSNSLSTDEIIEMYNDKYDDDFSYVAGGGAVWTAEYYDVTLHSEKLDADVVAYFYEDGRVIDNYMAIYYKEDVEALIQPIAEEVYGNCLVVNTPLHYGREHFIESMTLESYMSTKKSTINISIATDQTPETGDKDIVVFVEALKEANIVTDISIYYYEPEVYSQVREQTQDGENLMAPFTPTATKQLSVIVDGNYTVTYSEWSE